MGTFFVVKGTNSNLTRSVLLCHGQNCLSCHGQIRFHGRFFSFLVKGNSPTFTGKILGFFATGTFSKSLVLFRKVSRPNRILSCWKKTGGLSIKLTVFKTVGVKNRACSKDLVFFGEINTQPCSSDFCGIFFSQKKKKLEKKIYSCTLNIDGFFFKFFFLQKKIHACPKTCLVF